ncbi:DUF4386 family protein [Microbacterium sp. Sa4CUA7]|uniref:DUF4386 family protein n=1 Tax=Microbacterium pullorum TaxID=2762236 RepID=A0ABR8S2N6_9MICO|nr:DUF4386 family protein [Microbacterium pullorum]MBD7957757.1 DUF4386 family protein [Microbacterium pullorum]
MMTVPGARAPAWAVLYRTAGWAGVLFVACGVAALNLYAIDTPPVTGGEATLLFITDHTQTYVAQQLLWLLPSVLAVVVFVALFIVLFEVDPSLSVLGLAIGGGSWVALIAVPVTSEGALSLVYLADRFAVASSTSASTYVAAAEAIIAENNTPSLAGVLSPLGVLLMSIPMAKCAFPRWIGWVGLATGGLGLASEALRFAVPNLYAVYGPLLWFWFGAVGVRLLLLSRSVAARSAAGSP